MKKIVILIFLALFLLPGTSICLQKPSPTPSKLSEPQQNEAKPKKAESNNQQYGSDEFPLAVKIIKSKEPYSEEASQTKNTEQYATTNWLLVIFNGLLALFTLGLFISTYKLWKTSAQTIELTKQEFVATHPPKLRVHSVSLERGSIEAGGGGKPWQIQFFIDNIGGSLATIEKSSLAFKMLEDPLPARLPFNNGSRTLSVKSIDRGESVPESIDLDYRSTINSFRILESAAATRPQEVKGEPFYFFGYIDYLDRVETRRRIAFCRQYNLRTKRFTAVKDEDYEYSY